LRRDLLRGSSLGNERRLRRSTQALGCPIHFSTTPTQITRPAPLLGEHTREVLRAHGYADADIDAFVADGVVAEAGAAPRR
jgi:crotonobetainyl-CoA:carnitine CoA-transferase CaiB-like acyl-CoA transferase